MQVVGFGFGSRRLVDVCRAARYHPLASVVQAKQSLGTATTQLAKKEHNVLFSDLIARVGLGQSGSSIFAVGFNGIEFNWSVGGHIGPLFHRDLPEGLTRLLDEYSFAALWAEIAAGIE